MAYESSGTLTTDKRTVDESETWSSQTDWEAYQSISDVEIVNGTVQLDQYTIPDSAIARYDAQELALSDGETVNSWPDETGNANDLSAVGGPQYSASAINGNPAVLTDGVDDALENTTIGTIAQPTTIIGVIKLETDYSSGTHRIWQSRSTTERQIFQVDSGSLKIYAGSEVSDGGGDVNSHIFAAVYDGADSVLRIDGTAAASGDAGANSLVDFILATSGDASQFWTNAHYGEVIVYNADLRATGELSGEESRLSGDWGITI